MNDQQRSLRELLQRAIDDLDAGRPAERTSYALQQALRLTHFTDMTDGSADDDRWRGIRGIDRVSVTPEGEQR